MKLDRRQIIVGVTTSCVAVVVGCTDRLMLPDELWSKWQRDWRWMETLARRRDWKMTPLWIAPPASEAAVAAVEARHGLRFPTQLRAVLTERAAAVHFGWNIPFHLVPLISSDSFVRMGGLRGRVWDLDTIDRYAIPNFVNWRRHMARRDISEAPNRPEMWENQFPIAELLNGDALTIDISQPDGPHPVRYFSHELEGMHYHTLAPDFFSFITAYSALGCAGGEQNDWFRFVAGEVPSSRFLDVSGEGAETWLAWLAADPNLVGPDEPPPSVVERTPADRALLDAARSNSAPAVTAALARGARPNVIYNVDWHIDKGGWNRQFCTPLNYAARFDDIALMERLVKSGATINTRRSILADAIVFSTRPTIEWLITHGARLNGWKEQREWPLHALINWHGDPDKIERIRASTQDLFRQNGLHLPDLDLDQPKSIDKMEYLERLELLLRSGANPDARWDNGITMLMWGGVRTAERLLAYGADVNARDHHGQTALHWAQTPEKARLLVANGGRINALSEPPADDGQSVANTPLQIQLALESHKPAGMVDTLLELGADPRVRDGNGRNTLAYCYSKSTFERMRSLGLDPLERMPDGGTLLHRYGVSAFSDPGFLEHLLDLGIRINDTDDDRQTFLHRLATMPETIPAAQLQQVIALGADKSIEDKAGRRAHDLAPASKTELRDVLR